VKRFHKIYMHTLDMIAHEYTVVQTSVRAMFLDLN